MIPVDWFALMHVGFNNFISEEIRAKREENRKKVIILRSSIQSFSPETLRKYVDATYVILWRWYKQSNIRFSRMHRIFFCISRRARQRIENRIRNGEEGVDLYTASCKVGAPNLTDLATALLLFYPLLLFQLPLLFRRRPDIPRNRFSEKRKGSRVSPQEWQTMK